MHDNEPAQKNKTASDFLALKHIVVLNTILINPCDFWLFPKLKMEMKGMWFKTISDIKKATTNFQEAISKADFQN